MPIMSLDEAIRQGKAARARGDTAGYQQALAAFKQGKAALARSKENISKDEKSYDPNSGTSGGQQVLEGVGGGLQNTGLRTARMLTPESAEGGLTKLIDEQTHADESMSGKQKFGKFLGEMVATAPLAGGTGAGVKMLTAAGRAGNAGRMLKLAANATEGAVAGQATTEDGAGMGAMLGAGALPVMRLLGKTGKFLARGSQKALPKDADVLIGHDANLDLGQMNPGGWVDRAIKAAENAPLGVGSRIRGNREAGLRPVIPALASDMAGMSRPTGALSAREGIDRALAHTEGKLGVVDNVGLDAETAGQLTAGRAGAARAGSAAHAEGGRKAGQAAVEDFRSDLHKDLLRASRSRYTPRRERRLIERDIGEQLGKLRDKELTPTALKKMASTFKTTARKYKEAAVPTEETRRLSRAYNRAAQMLESRIEKSLAEAGEDVGAYQAANKQFGDLQPLQSAVVKTGATEHGLINPNMLEKSLQKRIGARKWTAGEGGAARDVTEALKRLQLSSFEGGSLQSSGLPSTVLRILQGTVGVPLSTKTAKNLATGNHRLGKALRSTGPKTKRLVKALAALHHGVPGALVED